jgi:hypothetical protein
MTLTFSGSSSATGVCPSELRTSNHALNTVSSVSISHKRKQDSETEGPVIAFKRHCPVKPSCSVTLLKITQKVGAFDRNALKDDIRVKRQEQSLVKHCSHTDAVQNGERQSRCLLHSVTAAFSNHLHRNKLLSSSSLFSVFICYVLLLLSSSVYTQQFHFISCV